MTQLRFYIFAPLLFVVVLFALDKIFLLPEVRANFIQPGGMLYYYQRKRQIKILRRALLRRRAGEKIAVVFGDSRSFAIGSLFAAQTGHRNVTVYNFAGPQALPAYHAYLAERILAGTHDPRQKPDYLLIGISPDALNRNSGVFASPVLAHGVDADWIQANRTHIPKRDYDAYVSTRRYALAGLQFSFKTLWKRLRGTLAGADDPVFPPGAFKGAGKLEQLVPLLTGASAANLSHYSLAKSPQARILDLGLGAQYAWFGQASDAELKHDTDRLVRLYLQSFALSGEQLYFMERTLQLARQHGVRTLVFFPQVNRHMYKAYVREPSIGAVRDRVAHLARRYGADAVDLNHVAAARCAQFYDASHLSFNCFAPVTDYLLKRVQQFRPR